MSYQNLLDLARRGNVQAIDVLLNRVFRSSGITAKTAVKDTCLHLLLEANQPPNQQTLVPAIRGAIVNLGIDNVDKMIIYGRQFGSPTPAWSQTILLESNPVNATPTETHQDAIAENEPLASGELTREESDSWQKQEQIVDSFDASKVPSGVGIQPQGSEAEPFEKNGSRNPQSSASASIVIDGFSDDRSHSSSNDLSPTTENRFTDGATADVESREVDTFEVISDDEIEDNTAKIKRTNPAKSLVIVSLAALSFAVMLWHSMVVSSQNRILDQAKALTATTVSADNAKSIKALQDSESQLQEAVNYLRSTPPTSGLAGRQIEQELATIESQLQAIRQRLSIEQNALKQFTAARKLANEAVKTAQAEKRTPKTLQAARQGLLQAINLLTDIPEQTFMAPEIQQKLAIYRANLAALNRLIASEQSRQQSQRVAEPVVKTRKRR